MCKRSARAECTHEMQHALPAHHMGTLLVHDRQQIAAARPLVTTAKDQGSGRLQLGTEPLEAKGGGHAHSAHTNTKGARTAERTGNKTKTNAPTADRPRKASAAQRSAHNNHHSAKCTLRTTQASAHPHTPTQPQQRKTTEQPTHGNNQNNTAQAQQPNKRSAANPPKRPTAGRNARKTPTKSTNGANTSQYHGLNGSSW